ncbi:MAG: DUF1330 domain-containing protein [Acidobacteria bacterium]|nr:DUF1330 domain-containing protein [Acidobacteriota bacterium]
MAGYVIINVEVTDESAYESLRKQVPAAVKAHGGRYLVRGGAAEVVRGDWTPHRLVVLEFDSVEQAREWQNAPDYADLRERLNRVCKTDIVIVEGA